MIRAVAIAGLLMSTAGVAALASPQNTYEWAAVAPIVATGSSLGQDGRYVDVRLDRVFRGDLEPGDIVRVDIRATNRDRSRNRDPHALHLHEGESYLLLLKEGERHSKGATTYLLVRGIQGARELPAEGAELLYGALERFIETQDLKNDKQIWVGLTEMLEETNPIVLQTALEQFQKFRRGSPELLIVLRPLLDHPEAEIREDTARLVGQIVQRNLGSDFPEESELRGELIGAARRDPASAVRVWATWALGRFPGTAADEVLEEISGSDPEQEVRYAAEKILLERRKSATASRFD